MKRWVIGSSVLVSVVMSTMTSCSTASIKDVYMALDGDGMRRRNVFYTDTVVFFCIVEYASGRDNATLEAQLRQVQRYDPVGRKFVNADRIMGATDIVPGKGPDGKLNLQLVKRAQDGEEDDRLPYLAGRYTCEVALDGEKQPPVTFNVEFPPCPTVQIIPGTVCAGFYEVDTICPAFGLTSKEPALCHCDALLGWTCP